MQTALCEEETVTSQCEIFRANVRHPNLDYLSNLFLLQGCWNCRRCCHLPARSSQNSAAKLKCLPTRSSLENFGASGTTEPNKRRPSTSRTAQKIQLNYFKTSQTTGNFFKLQHTGQSLRLILHVPLSTHDSSLFLFRSRSHRQKHCGKVLLIKFG